MSLITDYNSQVDYLELLNLSSIYLDISNSSRSSIQDRVDLLEFYKSIGISKYNVQILSNANINTIQLTNDNPLTQNLMITQQPLHDYVIDTGPSGEHIQWISVYNMSIEDIRKYAISEIELNKNPFFVDLSNSFALKESSGILASYLLSFIKNDISIYIDYFKDIIDTSMNIQNIFIDFSNNYLSRLGLQERPNEIQMKEELSVYYYLSKSDLNEIEMQKIETLIQLDILPLDLQESNTYYIKHNDNKIYVSIDTVKKILAFSKMNDIEKNAWNLKGNQMMNYIINDENDEIFFDMLTFTRMYDINILHNELIDTRTNTIYDKNSIYRINTLKNKLLDLDLSIFFMNRDFNSSHLLRTTHLKVMKQVQNDFSNNELSLKSYCFSKILFDLQT